jgi:hypothetical protein
MNIWQDSKLRSSGRTMRMLEAVLFEVGEGRQCVVVSADTDQQRKLHDWLLAGIARALELRPTDSWWASTTEVVKRLKANLARFDAFICWMTLEESLRAFASWPKYSRSEPVVFIDHRAQEELVRRWIERGGGAA